MRPLSATSEAADDCNLLPLTPSHLINVQSLNPLPDELNQHEEKETKGISSQDGTSEKGYLIIIGNYGAKNI